MRPATLVDGHVIFEDGAGRKLTRKELRLLYAKQLKTVPRSDARHVVIGQR